MNNIKNILPSIPEDDFGIGTYREDVFFDPDGVQPLVDILYSMKNRKIKKGLIGRKEKKRILSNILETQENILDVNFIMRLKKLLPEGLCYENICTDSEYESLKKEFNI